MQKQLEERIAKLEAEIFMLNSKYDKNALNEESYNYWHRLYNSTLKINKQMLKVLLKKVDTLH